MSQRIAYIAILDSLHSVEAVFQDSLPSYNSFDQEPCTVYNCTLIYL